MSAWTIYERARNIGTARNPHFATIWKGRDEEGAVHWTVGNKPDSSTADGPIYSNQGGPSSSGFGNTPTTLREAISQYKRELAETV